MEVLQSKLSFRISRTKGMAVQLQIAEELLLQMRLRSVELARIIHYLHIAIFMGSSNSQQTLIITPPFYREPFSRS